ncbi:MAG: hypothetical protein FJ164_01195 [Gammaproteobacteria bacterium]|nr:hypothetical protein [Gammaproteobacteria bacterium]
MAHSDSPHSPTAHWRARLPAFALCGLLVAHGVWRASLDATPVRVREIPDPPPQSWLSLAALGDEVALSRILMLWLQAFDTQAGARLGLRDLDYARVEAWLRRCLELAPEAQYPLLAASRFYAEVPDSARARRMLDFVSTAFAEDPARRWPWLAHAVFVARHRLKDPALALVYARQLAREKSANIPNWARQMEIFVLEDIGELTAARILLGGLLDSGQITDPHEARFLAERLAGLEAKEQERHEP